MCKTILKYLLEFLLKEAKKALPLLEEMIIEEAKVLLEDAEEFLAGDTFTEAKAKLLDKAFERINLPLVLKPFKGLIKKAVKGKVDEALENLLRELKEKLANK